MHNEVQYVIYDCDKRIVYMGTVAYMPTDILQAMRNVTYEDIQDTPLTDRCIHTAVLSISLPQYHKNRKYYRPYDRITRKMKRATL